jgi:hypothetical protein
MFYSMSFSLTVGCIFTIDIQINIATSTIPMCKDSSMFTDTYICDFGCNSVWGLGQGCGCGGGGVGGDVRIRYS